MTRLTSSYLTQTARYLDPQTFRFYFRRQDNLDNFGELLIKPKLSFFKFGAEVVAQLAKRLLPTRKVNSLYPVIGKVFIEYY